MSWNLAWNICTKNTFFCTQPYGQLNTRISKVWRILDITKYFELVFTSKFTPAVLWVPVLYSISWILWRFSDVLLEEVEAKPRFTWVPLLYERVSSLTRSSVSDGLSSDKLDPNTAKSTDWINHSCVKRVKRQFLKKYMKYYTLCSLTISST